MSLFRSTICNAAAVAAVAEVHSIFHDTRRIHVMSAGRRIYNAFVAIGPGSVVTALCCGNVSRGLLTRQSPLADEHWARWIAQIPDIDVLVRVPSIGRGLEDGVCDTRIAFPPGMVRGRAVIDQFHELCRHPWIGRVPDFPVYRSVMPKHVPVIFLPSRQGVAAAHCDVRCATRR